MPDIALADVDAMLQELSPEEPCGPNLEYDPSFLELEQVAKGKPEVQYGGTVTPAVPPDWKAVRSITQDLIKRSRDLRIAVPMARSLLNMQGIGGFAAGLLLIEKLIETRWETVHPQLDPDDGNDPMSRINTIAALCESSTVLRDVKESVLVASRAHGRFSLRDIDIATGELEAPAGEEKPSLAVIDAATMDIELNDLQAVCQALNNAFESSQRIERVLTEKVGVGQALDLSALSKLLKRARDFMQERLSRRGGAETADAGDAAGAAADAPAGDTGAQAAQPRPRSDEIASREDVVRVLEKICAYYAKYEPSSPVPLLLERAQRLAMKSFVEILQDIAPDSLTQVYQISGAKKEA